MTAATAAPAPTKPTDDGDGEDDGSASATMMGESDALYRDLVAFLSSPRNDLRKAASSAALAALCDESDSAADDAARRLASLDDAVPALCKIASVGSQAEAGSIDALAALSVLCSHERVGGQCVLDFVDEKSGGVGRMLEIALSNPPPASSSIGTSEGEGSDEDDERDEWRRKVNYACALLANATRDEKGAVEFIGLSFPKEAVPSSSYFKDGIEEGGEDGKGSGEGNGAAAIGEKRDTARPTATLLLSRFLNPAFIDTSSPAYKRETEAWERPKNNGKSAAASFDLDEYDSDLDDEALENDEPPAANASQEPRKIEPTTNEGEHCDPYQHVAAVLMNIAQLNTGRDFLMRIIRSSGSNGGGATAEPTNETTTSHLQSLLPQLDSPNANRRRAVAGALKNCCFAKDSTWWLLHEVRLDKYLLLPLSGPEELTVDEKVGLDPDCWLSGPSKVREPDAGVRLQLVEALLLLLASGRAARETLRERRTYVIVKMADMVEEDEGVSERMLECVQYLRRDEEGDAEGSSDRRAYERYARGMMTEDGARNERRAALPPSDGAAGEEDYDNID